MHTKENKQTDLNGSIKDGEELVAQSDKKADLNGQILNNKLFGTVTITSSDKPKFNEKPWIVILGTILMPFLVAVVGFQFTEKQTKIANDRQDNDSADKAIETREQVLTDYSKAIAELMTKENLEKKSDESVKNIARGQTLIALRRLNVSDDKSKVDAGKLKGLLIRYLYDTQLIGYDCSYVNNPNCDARGDSNEKLIIDLFGANITNVVLEDAWLPGIGLQKAWLNEGNFKNAYLQGANLYQVSLINADFSGANLTRADLTGADLRFTKLTKAKISEAKLEAACYVKGTEAKYFPPGFKPETFKMVAFDEDKSDPSKPNFERCPTVFLGAIP
ncbi:MAG TPA: pentapeptide repeat-containing protein [Chroococcales cyanobacterium]|jgi:uncharacterized protein YjbI with pentapeptide repeats